MKAVVVIPTYNEAENIVRLIPELLKISKEQLSSHELHILVVDSNSPDGTAKVVTDLASKYTNVHLLLEQKKSGLGAAYMLGFKHALKELSADIVVEMDADFQHRPIDLPLLINAITDGNDYVIGSRYISGGSIPKEWAFYRKFLSVVGNIFTKIVLGIYSVSDFTTGFKATRVKGFLDKLDLNSINSAGFAYKMDLLYKMHLMGARIKEVPIKFGVRDRGDSKMERDNALDSLRVVFLLKSQNSKNLLVKSTFDQFYKWSTLLLTFLARPDSKSFIKFVITGFIGLTTDTLGFNLIRITSLGTIVAAPVSGVIAMTTTFMLNNYWSFGDRKLEGNTKKAASFIFYIFSSSIPISIRTWLVNHAVTTFGDTFIVANIAFISGVLFGLIWNYTVYSKIIWRKKSTNLV